MSNNIRKLLNIKDPHIKFSNNCVEKVENKLVVKCDLTYPVLTCPCCRMDGLVVKNGTRSSKNTYLERCELVGSSKSSTNF